MAGTTNITVSVPDGSYFHDDQLCTPVSWTSVLTFFLSNYVVHVATVQFYPGEHGFPKYFALATALLFPTAGLARGLDRIYRCAVRGKSELSKAAKSGALLMVIRAGGWRPTREQKLADVIKNLPSPGTCPEKSAKNADKWLRTYAGRALGREPLHLEDFVNDDDVCGPVELTCQDAGHNYVTKMLIYVYRDLWSQDCWFSWKYMGVSDYNANRSSRVIHGEANLPDGYTLAFVPHDAVVEPIDESVGSTPDFVVNRPEDVLHPSYDLAAGLSSIVQLLFGLTTLYDAVGPQIERFGYAAFGLTVIPYTLMSFINLIGATLTPVYDSAYLVDSEILQEARSRGGTFKNVVGKLKTSVELGDAAFINGPQRTFELPAIDSDIPREHRSSLSPSEKTNATVVTGRKNDLGNTTQEERSNASSTELPFQFNSDTFGSGTFGVIQRYTDADSYEKDTGVRLGKRPDLFVTCYTIESASRFLEQQRSRLTDHDIEKQPHGLVTIGESANGASPAQLGVICVPSHTPIARTYGAVTENEGDASAWTIWLVAAVSLLPWGVLSHFKPAESSITQRVCIMLWLAIGIFFGALFAKVSPEPSKDSVHAKEDRLVRLGAQGSLAVAASICAAASLAGFVQVGLMYTAFGNCNSLG